MWTLFLALILLLTARMPNDARADQAMILKRNSSDYEPMIDLVLLMVRRFISTQTATLHIMEECQYCVLKDNDYHSKIIEYFVKNSFSLVAKVIVSESSPTALKWNYALLLVDTSWAFDRIMEQLTAVQLDDDPHLFIVLTDDTLNSYNDYARTTGLILKACQRVNILNAVVLRYLYGGGFGFFAYRLFNPVTCRRQMLVEQVNRFQNGTLQRNLLFPPLQKDFKNCTIYVCARLGSPFFMQSGDPKYWRPYHQLRQYYGVEADLLKVLEHELNFRVSLRIIPGIRFVPQRYGLGGCLLELKLNRVDAVIGVMTASDENAYQFSLTSSYFQSSFTFAVRSGFALPRLDQLSKPFQDEVWICIQVFLVIGVVVIIVVKKFGSPQMQVFIWGRHNNSPIFNLLMAYIGVVVPMPLPRRNFARYLLTLWLLFTFVFRSAYVAKLYDVLRTAHYAATPKNLEQLIERKYILIASAYVDYYPRELTLIERNPMVHLDMVRINRTHHTTISTMDSLAYYNQKLRERSDLTYVDEPLHSVQVVMFFAKHSILRNVFDEKLQQLLSGGLISHVAAITISPKYRNNHRGSVQSPQITNSLFIVVYTVFLLYAILSVLLFVLERLTRRSNRLKRFFDWLHFGPTDA